MHFETLSAWLAHLENAHPIGIDMGLERITQVRQALNLQLKCRVITVGGTNGKGSICSMLEHILHAAGYRVGCHTSPHLLTFNERARIASEQVSDAQLLPHFAAVEQARLSLSTPITLTYFEFTTLAILHLFSQSGLDVAILEVGMGGRLDAVNIIDADCAIISSIDLDHTHYLGNTRELIGREKAGIFRPERPAICADPMPPLSLLSYAKELNVDLWLSGRDFSFHGDRQQWTWSGRGKRYASLGYPALRGANQLLNAAAAIAALTALRQHLPVALQDIRNGLARVELVGRFQVLPGKPTVILDVAHNPHAAVVLAQNLENMGFYRYTWAIFGAMQDKDIVNILVHLQDKIDHWCLTELPTPRAANCTQLEHALRTTGYQDDQNHSLTTWPDPSTAYAHALKQAGENDRILVFGSFYTVAGVISHHHAKPSSFSQ